MKANIVRIGNSQGVRLPKAVLEQTRLVGEVELEVRDRQIIIRPVEKPRRNWAQQFRAMADNGDDKLLDAEALARSSSWDKDEWQWT